MIIVIFTHDEQNFIGFNQKHDYLTGVPESGIFKSSKTFFPGVAFNFNFIIRKESFLNEDR